MRPGLRRAQPSVVAGANAGAVGFIWRALVQADSDEEGLACALDAGAVPRPARDGLRSPATPPPRCVRSRPARTVAGKRPCSPGCDPAVWVLEVRDVLHLSSCRAHVAVGVLALRRVVDARAWKDAELHTVGAVALSGVRVREVRQRPRARIVAVNLRTEGPRLRQASRAG